MSLFTLSSVLEFGIISLQDKTGLVLVEIFGWTVDVGGSTLEEASGTNCTAMSALMRS